MAQEGRVRLGQVTRLERIQRTHVHVTLPTSHSGGCHAAYNFFAYAIGPGPIAFHDLELALFTFPPFPTCH